MSRPQPPWRSHLLALLCFALLTGTMTYPLGFQAWNSIENYGDPLLSSWILAWDVHQLVRDPPRLFQANNFHPYPNTLAYSENLLTIAVLAIPFLLLTGNPIWTHNLFLLLSFVLCGWTAYLLVYDQTRSWVGGLVAGSVYAFAHYRWGHISHLQLLSAQWLPLAVLYLRRFLQRGYRPRDAVLAAGFFILQALSCTYYAFYTALVGLLYLPYGLLTPRSRLNWRLLRGVLLAGAVVLLALIPVVVPYLQARTVVGEFELEAQSGARLVAWISAAEGTLLGSLRPFDAFGRRSEHTFFPGVIALVLAVWGLVQRWTGTVEWTPPEKGFYISLIALAWVLALGPDLRLIGGRGPIFEPLPYAYLYRLPGLSAMRVPARLVLLVMLGIAVLAGCGAAQLHSQQKRWGLALTLAIVALIAVDYCPAPLHLRPIAVGREVPAAYRWLAAQAPGSPIVELPSASSVWFLKDRTSLQRLARQQVFSTYHWQPMIMGYSGMYPPLFREHIANLLSFPSLDALAYLRGLDVRYVIVHWDELWGEQRDTLERGLRRFAEHGQLVSMGWLADDEIFELSSVESEPPMLELHCPPSAPSSGPYYAYLLAHTGEDRAFVSPALTHFQVRYQWQDSIRGAGRPRSVGRAANPGSGLALDPLRSTGHSAMPLTAGPGTMVVPLALSYLPSSDSRLEVGAQVLGHALHAQQRVQRLPSEDAATATQFVEVGIPGLEGELWWVEQPYEQGLTLSHVSLPRGREYMAGDTINVTLVWRNEIEARQHVPSVSIQLFDPAENRVAQRDVVLANGLYRQQDWRAEQIVLDRHLLTLTPWLPPGEYQILISLYETRRVRLLGPRIHAGPITVQRPPLDPRLIKHKQWAQLGEKMVLLGYSLSEEHVQPGDRVALTLFWEPQGPIDADYSVFTHLLGPQGIITQADGQPGGGAYPTSHWIEEQVVEDRHEWFVPDDTLPGEYPIEVGMYLLDTGERVPVHGEEGDRVLLGVLEVTPRPR